MKDRSTSLNDSSPNDPVRQDSSRVDRRGFLGATGRAVGAVAVAAAWPAWRLFVRPDPAAPVRRVSWAMGTQVSLSAPDLPPTDTALSAGITELVRIQDRLSAHDPASALSTLNRSAGRWLEAGSDLAAVARAAARLADLTDGAVDPTVLPALRAYGFMPGDADPSFRERIGISHLRLADGRIRIDEGGYAVDLGGIAKGYGVDRAIEAIGAAGIGAALVDAGGDLFARSRPTPDRPWRIGIRDPRRPDRIFARLDIEDEAAATSGTYFQKRIVDGREVSHLIDPKSGNPVAHVLSATVLAPDAMTADALATAACVLPVDRARILFESLPGIEALWVPAEGPVVMTSGLRRRVEFV